MENGFFGHLDMLKKYGSKGGRIFQNVSDKNEVFVWLEWDTVENFHTFRTSHDPEQSMKEGGVIGEPEGWFLEEVEKVDV